MAQAGRLYPRATWQDLYPSETPNVQNGFPPRKIKAPLGVGIGSLMAKWDNLTVFSEVCERMDDGVRYIFPHPTITTDNPYIELQYLLKLNPLTGNSYYWHYWCAYWEAGTRWGVNEDENVVAWFQLWRFTTPINNFSGNPWKDHVDLAQFTRINFSFISVGFRVATWEEQPEFQPYRTRP